MHTRVMCTHCSLLAGIVLHIVQCCIELYYIVLCSIVLYCVVLHCIALYCMYYHSSYCLTCSRLTTDVQDFKSSFKMCVSIGLRSITQVVGGVVSLFLISPQMASVMALGLPLMIGIGSLMGSGLRVLSRKAQEQVCHGTTLLLYAIVRSLSCHLLSHTCIDSDTHTCAQTHMRMYTNAHIHMYTHTQSHAVTHRYSHMQSNIAI